MFSCHSSLFHPLGRQEQDVAEAQVFVPCWSETEKQGSLVSLEEHLEPLTPHGITEHIESCHHAFLLQPQISHPLQP